MKALAADKWGLLMSQACAVHCVFPPMLSVAVPFLGGINQRLAGFEWYFLAFSTVIASYAMRRSWTDYHNALPALLAASGLLMMAAAKLTYDNTFEFIPFRGHMLLVNSGLGWRLLAGCLIFSGHAVNIRLSRHFSRSTMPSQEPDSALPPQSL
jgi:hypothetical protein